MGLVVVIAVGVGRVSIAAPDKRVAALQAARKLAEKGFLAKALNKLEEGLVLSPNDPDLLSEAGSMAFRLHDYRRAKIWTDSAIANAVTPDQRGAALYNLGRLLEAQGEHAGAVDAYVRSLAQRANETVRERLAQLDPLATRPMAGPYQSVQDFCAQESKRVAAKRNWKAIEKLGIQRNFSYSCDVGDDLDSGEAERLVFNGSLHLRNNGPFVSGRLVISKSSWEERSGGFYVAEMFLAVQISRAWFVEPIARISLSDKNGGELINVETMRYVDQPGSAPWIEVRFTRTSDDGEGEDVVESKYVVFASVGQSQRPSITSAVEVSRKKSFKYEVDVSVPGRVEMKALSGTLPPWYVQNRMVIFP
jgi:hypothetical protein